MLKKELNTKIILQLLSPIVITLILIVALNFILDEHTFYAIMGIAGLSWFACLGKFVILAGIMPPFNLHPIVAAITIIYLDVVFGVFFLLNFDWLYKAPFIGKTMKKLEEKGKNMMLKYQWVEKLAFWGLVICAIYPGSVITTFVGRFIGLKAKLVLYAIIIGSIAGALGIAYFGEAIKVLFEYNKILGITILGIIAIFVIILYYKKDIKDNKITKNN